MKKLALILALVLALTTFSFACAEQKDPILVAMSMCKQDENFVRMKDLLLGFWDTYTDPAVEVIWTNAEDNMEKQLADIDSLLIREPDVMIIFPVDSEGSVPGLEAALATGIPVCDAGYLINSTKQNVQILEWDEPELGRMQGYYINEWLEAHPGENLKLGYIEGSQKNTAQLARYVGCWEAITDVWGEDTDRVEFVERQNAPTWSTQEAMQLTEDWLQLHPDLDGIICAADCLAVGVINVLKTQGRDLDDFMILSIDGTEDGINYVRKGELDGTVYMDMAKSSANVADIVYNLALGAEYEDFQIYSGKGCAYMVTPENEYLVTEF